MDWIWLAAAAWLLVAVLLALGFGRMVQLANRREDVTADVEEPLEDRPERPPHGPPSPGRPGPHEPERG